MNIQLTEAAERLVKEQIEAGFFKSPEDVIEAAVAALAFPDASEKLDALRAMVAEGIAELDAGLGQPWDGDAIWKEAFPDVEIHS